MLDDVNAVELPTAAISLLTAAGVLLNSYWLYRLDSKLERLTGRVEEQSEVLIGHVNAPGLHVLAASSGMAVGSGGPKPHRGKP